MLEPQKINNCHFDAVLTSWTSISNRYLGSLNTVALVIQIKETSMERR